MTREEIRQTMIDNNQLRDIDGFKKVNKVIARSGYITKHDLRKHLERLETQKQLLLQKPHRGYRQASWSERYAALNRRIISFFVQLANKRGDELPKESPQISGEEVSNILKREVILNEMSGSHPQIREGADTSKLLTDGTVTYRIDPVMEPITVTRNHWNRVNPNTIARWLKSEDLYINKDDLTVGNLIGEEADELYRSQNLLRAILDDNLKLDLPTITPEIPETISLSDSGSTIDGNQPEPNRPIWMKFGVGNTTW
jgi:hypothetical protein